MAPPEILFKYRSLEGGAKSHTLRAISHREIRFSSVREFNDPFEARVSISMEGDDAAWQRQFGGPRPDQDRVARLLPDLQDGARQNVEKLGMLCLSAKGDDILMWSHYSSSHQGICLGFRTTGNSILSDAQPVDYADLYPVVDYLGMTSEQCVSKMIRI